MGRCRSGFPVILSLVFIAGLSRPATCQLAEYRSIDGSGNNLAHSTWGATNIPLLRRTPSYYQDGLSTPAGPYPSPRAISDAVVAQGSSTVNSEGVSDFVWQWGQFVDHDLSRTPVQGSLEPFDIPVPTGDPFFDPNGTGTQFIYLQRSKHNTGGVRQQINTLTAFIDASMVYGADTARAGELRTRDGTGRLKTSPGGLPPFNTHRFTNDPDRNDSTFFLTGDVRASEQLGLIAIHTLFVREHNYRADSIRAANPSLTDEQIYQLARAIVAAEVEIITYREFLPVVLGPNTISPYAGYQSGVNPGVETMFSAAAYRFGHTMLSPQLLRLDAMGNPIPQGNTLLRDGFFVPMRIVNEGGIDPLLRGLSLQPAQELDPFLIDEVRNFLFGPPGAGGFDLASLNIQRGRDHGLPRYNQARRDLGLTAKASFAEVSSSPTIQARLASVYASVEDIDLWLGGLCEDKLPGALLGELFSNILKDQFERVRDGDRLWYQVYLPAGLIAELEAQKLSDIIRRNTGIGREIPDDVFHTPGGPLAVTDPSDRQSVHPRLGRPFPNPTGQRVALALTMPESPDHRVEVSIFDAQGRRTRTLHDGPLPTGTHVISWDHRDTAGRPVGPGVYFYRVRHGDHVDGRMFVVIRSS